eukprot:jgi/Chrzof1/75/Cz01g02200.t1
MSTCRADRIVIEDSSQLLPFDLVADGYDSSDFATADEAELQPAVVANGAADEPATAVDEDAVVKDEDVQERLEDFLEREEEFDDMPDVPAVDLV